MIPHCLQLLPTAKPVVVFHTKVIAHSERTKEALFEINASFTGAGFWLPQLARAQRRNLVPPKNVRGTSTRWTFATPTLAGRQGFRRALSAVETQAKRTYENEHYQPNPRFRCFKGGCLAG